MAGKAGKSGRKRSNNLSQVIALWHSGYNYSEIAEMAGLSPATVSNKISDMGLTDRAVTKNWMQKKGVSKQVEPICIAHGMDATESSIGDVWDAVCAELKACGA